MHKHGFDDWGNWLDEGDDSADSWLVAVFAAVAAMVERVLDR